MAYRTILLCVDNSLYSGHAADQAAVVARACNSRVVAAHVYAARLHDRRFEDLEPGLPQKYQDPSRLESSRRLHGPLIDKGLQIISDSYLAATRARLAGLSVEEKSLEGKNYVELVRESTSGYDLAVIGARGLGLASTNGHCPAEALGSVCERFLRRARTDVLVVKDSRPVAATILVGIDGSPEAYAALRKALRLAEAVGGRVTAVSCFDSEFHSVAFRSIAGVLSQKDARVFRFKEQEQLHNDVINEGLANLYQGYLENAQIVARGRGQEIETQLLTGKPAYAIAALLAARGGSRPSHRGRRCARLARRDDREYREYLREEQRRQAGEAPRSSVGRMQADFHHGLLGQRSPTLLVVARFGLHRTDDLDIGSTAETLVRLAPGNVLVVNETAGDQPLVWTEEAEARLQGVPGFMRPMVKRAVESHARARGLTEITAEVVTSAKTTHGVRMPGHQPDA